MQRRCSRSLSARRAREARSRIVVSAVVFFGVSGARLRALVPTAVAARPDGDRRAGHDRAVQDGRRRLRRSCPSRGDGGARPGGVRRRHRGRVRPDRQSPSHAPKGRADRRRSSRCRRRPVTRGRDRRVRVIGRAPARWTQDRWREFKHLDSDGIGGQPLRAARLEPVRLLACGLRTSSAATRWPASAVTAGRSRTGATARARSALSARTRSSSTRSARPGSSACSFSSAAGLAILVAVGRRAGESLVAAGALGAGAYFAIHTGGDWVWSIPAVGVPAFAILGIGASIDRTRVLPSARSGSRRRRCHRRRRSRLCTHMALRATRRSSVRPADRSSSCKRSALGAAPRSACDRPARRRVCARKAARRRFRRSNGRLPGNRATPRCTSCSALRISTPVARRMLAASS